MSLEADAQSTTDETNSCSSSSLEEVVNWVKVIALNQQENAEEIQKISSVQEEIKAQLEGNAKEIKEQLAGNSSVLKEEIKKITSKSCESAESAKQALVSALVGEYLISFSIFSTTAHSIKPINQSNILGGLSSATTARSTGDS